ncbi:IclR family transcriptional regulator [Trinickia caryophylli]|uniref:IclR family transcriptional regulator n=1 Tax=Trinickia caryophylli TaxID=28094 RepID=UPI000A14CBA9|nr:IclR family transcriptional regulator [Trinickia caryophylli]PMS11622.1 IclR family transcriptional regulator [Trinickia caryophylli]TRX19819.1 IclR family transcriptional regulator [Trinickia caryophylli]WQE12852.1 IclR family transcriptional regulator [Trinickia caryophylli]
MALSSSTAAAPNAGSAPPGADERRFVVALARGLELLRAFRPGETLLGNADLVARTGLPKATVNRLAYTLTVLGYLRFDEALGKYALDSGVLALGYALLSGTDTLEIARPHMRALAREIGAAVSLGCRDGLDMVYLETIRSETALTLGLAPGSRLSMLTSSMGRAYLAVLPEVERTALLGELKQAAGKGRRAAALVAGAQREIAAFAREGCCFSFRDWHDDVNAAAVPFRDPHDGRWFVLSCSGPASSMNEVVFRERIAPRLSALARRLGEVR